MTIQEEIVELYEYLLKELESLDKECLELKKTYSMLSPEGVERYGVAQGEKRFNSRILCRLYKLMIRQNIPTPSYKDI